MPMPGKTPEEQARQGVLQYAKAWGGMSSVQHHVLQYDPKQLTHSCREPTPLNPPRNPRRRPTHAPFPDTAHALPARPAL